MKRSAIHKHICNLCGHVEDVENEWEQLHKFTGTPGYGSMYDGDEITLYFCSKCLDNIVIQDRPEEKTANKKHYWE